MKKIVPDPPRRILDFPFFSIHSGIIPPDALAHASELMRGWPKPSTNTADSMPVNQA